MLRSSIDPNIVEPTPYRSNQGCRWPLCCGPGDAEGGGPRLLRERVGAVQAKLAAGPGAALEDHCAALVQQHGASCAHMHGGHRSACLPEQALLLMPLFSSRRAAPAHACNDSLAAQQEPP